MPTCCRSKAVSLASNPENSTRVCFLSLQLELHRALHQSCKDGDVETIRKLVKHPDLNIDFADEVCTALLGKYRGERESP